MTTLYLRWQVPATRQRRTCHLVAGSCHQPARRLACQPAGRLVCQPACQPARRFVCQPARRLVCQPARDRNGHGRIDGLTSHAKKKSARRPPTRKKIEKPKCVSNDRSRRDDSNGPRIVKIGAILGYFWPLQSLLKFLPGPPSLLILIDDDKSNTAK